MDKNMDGITMNKIITRVVVITVIIIAIILLRKFMDRATLSKFYSGFSDYAKAVEEKYTTDSITSVSGKTSKKKKLVYYQIATGKTYAAGMEPIPTGLIEDLNLEMEPSQGLKGTEYYEILSDSVLSGYGYRRDVFFYGSNKYEEKHYVTDEGTVFTLPGFYVDDDGVDKYYITPKVYYTGEKVNGKGNITNYVKVGDYVQYEPDFDSYTASPENTGYASDQIFTTTYRNWRVWNISKSGVVSLVPVDTVNDICLVGSIGYLSGADEINELCKKLYSSNKYDAVARSMQASDVEENALYNKNTYSNDSSFKYGDTKAYSNGVHYSYEENGETKYNEKIATNGSKVTVKQSEYAYYPINWKSINSDSNLLKEVLGERYSWLATRCSAITNDKAYYGMQIVSGKNIDKARLCDSNNEEVKSSTFAIRPIVELNVGTDVIAGDFEDGTSALTAWKLKAVR